MFLLSVNYVFTRVKILQSVALPLLPVARRAAVDAVSVRSADLLLPLPDKGCGSDETSNVTSGAYRINKLEQTLGLFKGCADVHAPLVARHYRARGLVP
jgi:hypothetical protein